MKILYFAMLRERLDRDSEEVTPPEGVRTVGELIDWLAGRDEDTSLAFGKRSLIGAAIDARKVGRDAPIAGAGTIALLPPMTGG